MVTSRRVLAAAIGMVVTAAMTSACKGKDDVASDEVVVYSIASITGQVLSQPEYKTVAEAAVEKINADGGIAGKNLKLVFCDTKLDPNIEAGCVREAIQAKAAAMVGGLEAYPDTFKQLEAAKIPSIGNVGFTPGAFENPISFPLGSGPMGIEATIASMVKAGSTKIGILVLDAPGAIVGSELLKAAAESASVEVSAYVKFPPATTDFTSYYAKVLESGADGVALLTGANSFLAAPTELKGQGYTGIASTYDGNLLDTTPGGETLSQIDGYYVSGIVPWQTSSGNPPALQEAIDTIEKYAPGTEISSVAIQQYAAFMLFASAMKDADRIDAASVLDTFNNLSNPVETGLIGPYSVVGKKDRLFNEAVYTGQVNDGEIVADSLEPRPLSEILGDVDATIQHPN
ncbi:ABC transporter substrate-binding protein [Rhodococcus aetherivorans]